MACARPGTAAMPAAMSMVTARPCVSNFKTCSNLVLRASAAIAICMNVSPVTIIIIYADNQQMSRFLGIIDMAFVPTVPYCYLIPAMRPSQLKFGKTVIIQ